MWKRYSVSSEVPLIKKYLAFSLLVHTQHQQPTNTITFESSINLLDHSCVQLVLENVVIETENLYLTERERSIAMSAIPSVALNLDEMLELNPSASATDVELSIAQKAVVDNVEKEKCVVSQYKTTTEQKDKFEKLLQESKATRIPVEWVIDIADEANGWFYGTAYHYNDVTNMLHVMVPDKENPSFDGEIPLDHRTVHLLECVDGKSEALFNKIVRDSVTKIRWDLEWFEEGAGTEKQFDEAEQNPGDTDSPKGRWVKSIARYYIQIANQLLVEDEDFGQDARGFVMLTADVNVRLHLCQKAKGIDNFIRLITENLVQSIPSALENSKKIAGGSSGRNDTGDGGRSNKQDSSGGLAGMTPARKLMEMSRGMRECLSDILDDRERLLAEQEKIARTFTSFALNGDMDAGLRLMLHAEQINYLSQEGDAGSGGGSTTQSKKTTKVIEQERIRDAMDTAADDAWYLAQKIEKHSTKIAKASGSTSASPSKESDVEQMRRKNQQMQRDIETRDLELKHLRDQLR